MALSSLRMELTSEQCEVWERLCLGALISAMLSVSVSASAGAFCGSCGVMLCSTVLVVGVGGVARLGVFPGDPKILRLALFTNVSTLLWRAMSALVLL